MPTRRQILAGATGLVGVAAASKAGLLGSDVAAAASMPKPADSGIDHIIVVMMENRSFDHYLGWLPGANGKQSGLTYKDAKGVAHRTHHLTTPQGCAYADPDHSYEGGRDELNGGKCDGWLRAGTNDIFSIGYYTAADQAFYGHAARDWTVFDNYFSATMAETYPNRFYQHSAQTDRTHNSTDIATMPTIWDRLAAKNISRKYYYTDVPFLALYGAKYLHISAPVGDFFADCAAGTLPAVSYVDPKFQDEGTGSSADDHPHADIRAGQYFLNQIYGAVTSSPNWARTALVINYDEWGGFFDHVVPSTAPDAHSDQGLGLRGFRVPCLLISPYARRKRVWSAGPYDHTSVLKMIEWRFGLPALTKRDAAARNLAEALDFTCRPNLSAPRYSVPPAGGVPCVNGEDVDYEDWKALASVARKYRWPIHQVV